MIYSICAWWKQAEEADTASAGFMTWHHQSCVFHVCAFVGVQLGRWEADITGNVGM